MKAPLSNTLLFFSIFVFLPIVSFSQHAVSSAKSIFQRLSESELNQNLQVKPLIKAKLAEYYTLLPESFVSQAPHFVAGQELMLPTSGGRIERFVVHENTTMSEGLKNAFPTISTADVRAVGKKGKWGKVSYTSKGFHAMIFEPGQSSIYIDPLYDGDATTHIVYRKSDFITTKQMDCLHTSGLENPAVEDFARSDVSRESYNSCELRTYRIAVATTGEYAIFHGGTVEAAMAAIVVTINRVTGVYERDFGVSFSLIANNADVVYIDPETDPFSNNQASTMLQQNQSNMNSVIGAQNYDVGHVFSTGAGGVAGLGVTCNNNSKARGVTGIAAPIGDPFDIDYVAHEIGHQFGANHTQNNPCNRSNATAAETGSGSTIMGYAGICFPNVQDSSDDYFHAMSLREVGIRITNNTCPVVNQLDNSSPIIAVMPSEVFVPVGTPFSLSAEVIDLEDDELTYAWEQMDIQPSPQPPQANSQQGPNFRSLAPSESKTRFFPNLNFMAFGGQNTWERLPDVAREMNFRLSVRDNNPLVGCTQYDDVTVNFVNTSGPFELLHPSELGIVWQGLDFETVLWNVAGTNQSPINAQFIDLYLSVSDFPEFDILLATGVPNTGSHTISVPNIATTTARIMARSSQGTFFDISNEYFTIVAIDEGVFLEVENLSVSACQEQPFSYSITATAVGPPSEDFITLSVTNLPNGVTAVFDENPIPNGGQSELTLLGSLEAPSGTFEITLNAENELFDTSAPLTFEMSKSTLNPVDLISPANAEMETSTSLVLQWTDVIEANETYTVQVALDPDFEDVISSNAGLVLNNMPISNLAPETTHFWRVGISNACTSEVFSETRSFTTFTCASSGISNAGINIEQVQGSSVSSSLTIETNGLVEAVSVKGVKGSHFDKSQLYFSLVSAEGTTIGLGGVSCGVEVHMTPGSLTVQITGGQSYEMPSSNSAPFGSPLPADGVQGAAVLAYDDTGINANRLCNTPINAPVINGKIAVVYRGGGCDYVQKILNAEIAGAVAVIVINDVSNDFIEMEGQGNLVSIPSVMIGFNNGSLLLQSLINQPPIFDLTFDDVPLMGTGCSANGTSVSQPEVPFSNLHGQTPNGTWSLQVDHFVGSAPGVLQAWELDVCTSTMTLQTEEVTDLDVRLYPNPTNGLTAIAWEKNDAFNDLWITDISGRRVMQVSARAVSQIDFNMSGLAAGVYVLNLIGDHHTYSGKLLLTR